MLFAGKAPAPSATLRRHLNVVEAELRGWFVQRREEIGDDRWQAALDEWSDLIAQVRARMAAGADPADPGSAGSSKRWQADSQSLR